jgi:hypothetical protein
VVPVTVVDMAAVVVIVVVVVAAAVVVMEDRALQETGVAINLINKIYSQIIASINRSCLFFIFSSR